MYRRSLAALVATTALAVGLVTSVPTAGAEPALTITPDAPWTEGQTVTVTGSGMTPGLNAGAGLCHVEVLEITNAISAFSFCESASVSIGQVAADGTFARDITLVRSFTVNGQAVDCAVPGNCVMGVASANADFTAREVLFAEVTVETALPPVTVDVALDRVDAGTIDATVTCSRPVDIEVRAEITQTQFWGTTQLQAFHSGLCDGPTPVELRLNTRNGGLSGRRMATTSVVVEAFENGGFVGQGEADLTEEMGPRAKVEPPAQNTSTDEVAITRARVIRHDGGLAFDVRFTCPAGEFRSVSWSVEQLVGTRQARWGGGRGGLPCDEGRHLEPISSSRRLIGPGRATVIAQIRGEAYRRATSFLPGFVWPDDLRLQDIPDPPSLDVQVVSLSTTEVVVEIHCEDGAPPFFFAIAASLTQLRQRRFVETSSGSTEQFCAQPGPETHALQMEGLLPLKPGLAILDIEGISYPVHAQLVSEVVAVRR